MSQVSVETRLKPSCSAASTSAFCDFHFEPVFLIHLIHSFHFFLSRCS